LLPLMYLLWITPHRALFVPALIQSALCFYMFGFHVHEKAILTATVPLSLICVYDVHYAKVFFFLGTVANFSLFPLLYTTQETPIKILLLLIHTILSYHFLQRYFYKSHTFTINTAEQAYLYGLIGVQLFSSAHSFILGDKLPFLPLLLTSVYCSIGVGYAYIKLYWMLFKLANSLNVYKQKVN